MDEHTHHNDPLAAAYAESVALERNAWQELHSHAPGTPERIRAWREWSEAISHTNDAWRRISARRFSEFGRAHQKARTETRQESAHPHAESHAHA